MHTHSSVHVTFCNIFVQNPKGWVFASTSDFDLPWTTGNLVITKGRKQEPLFCFNFTLKLDVQQTPGYVYTQSRYLR